MAKRFRVVSAALLCGGWMGLCGGWMGLCGPFLRAEARPPEKIGTTCVSSQCHSQIGRQGKSIHRPARFGHCLVCHKQPQSRRHRFLLEPSPKSCLTCHRRHKAHHTPHSPLSLTKNKRPSAWNCLSCHHPHQSPQKALLRKPPNQLCQTCHTGVHLSPSKMKELAKGSETLAQQGSSHPPVKQGKGSETLAQQGSSHLPVKQGDCLHCHRPHPPSPKARLMRLDTNQTCVGCHRKQILSKQHTGWQQLHPRLAFQCNRCHQPHASPHRKLLRETGSAMCLQCHSKVNTQFTSHRSIHPPATKNCLQCHVPHGSPHQGLLKAPQDALCRSCHQNVYRRTKGERSAHPLHTQQSGCLGCHRPHSSEHKSLKTMKQEDLCLSCHQESLRMPSGRILRGFRGYAGQKLHDPVQKGRCLDCHQPHRSVYAWLLRGSFSAEIYTSDAIQKNGLCYTCHSKTLTEHRLAHKQETRFRNGLLNLHFLHVNKPKRGFNCNVCHAAHGSRQHGIIRQHLPYGKKGWLLPIRFNKHADGGGCVSGCHASKDYRRTHPHKQGYLLHPPPYTSPIKPIKPPR